MDSVASVKPEVMDSPSRWFLRAAAVTVLLMAAINALSYFYRSANWTGLVANRSTVPTLDEAIGFPNLMWESRQYYGGLFVDYPMLLSNVAFAVMIGFFAGLITAYQSNHLNRLLSSIRSRSSGPREQQPIQFTLRGMLLSTGLIAFAVALATTMAAHPITLVAIYALGPSCLVGIAMIPRRLRWQTRVAIIIPVTLCLIIVAVSVGFRLKIDFDRVLLGIFLCWVPQSAFAAIGLTTWIFWQLTKHNQEDYLAVDCESDTETK